MINETAAKIYKFSKESNTDVVLLLLQIIHVIDNEDIGQIIEVYKKIKHGEIDIVNVYSPQELAAVDKEKIEEAITPDFNNPIFMYFINKELLGGLKIVVDDYVLDETIVSKIDRLKLK